jgi:phage terminase large subunit
MEVTLRATPVFQRNWDSTKRFVLNQGGTRSSKTFSILQVLIVKALQAEEPTTISIVRKTLPALKKSVLRDFISILDSMGIYDDTQHNKSDNTYQLNNTLVEFFSIDTAAKYRGSKRDYLFINEANELTFEDIFQLQVRTTKQVFADYNPSDSISWIYDLIDQRSDEVDFIKSTYLDNTFLEQSIIDEIVKLKETDEDYWRVYGLGERGGTKDLVYTVKEIDTTPEDAILIGLGLDFGFSHDPTALIGVWKKEDSLYFDELLYERGLTNYDLIQKLKEISLDKRLDIVADSADPKSIEELRRSGYAVKPALKGPDSIRNGIDILKRHKLYVTKQSPNLLVEFQRYKWRKDSAGNMLNQPVDVFNHGMDSIRYVALNMLKIKPQNTFNISILSNDGASYRQAGNSAGSGRVSIR